MIVYDPYFRQIPSILSEETRKELLNIAQADGAFVDISYKISFFKHPKLIQRFNTTGLDCVCQMLRVTENGSKIHKDKDRMNEIDNIFMPRTTVLNFPLLPTKSATVFYDENENEICRAVYNGGGAILNTGGILHNVDYKDSEPRLVFQLCFSQQYNEVCEIYENELMGVVI